MFNNRAQTINTGLDMPSGSLSQSDSKGMQMQYSQYMDSEKMAPIQQRTNNLEFMEVDYKPSICNVSHVDGVMASLETGLSSNFQGPSGLMRYHSAPSSFFSNLEEEENNNIISQYFSNDTSIPSQSNIKTTEQHQSRISASHLRENDLAKRHGECNEYLKRNAHQIPSLKRSAGHAGRDDLGKHHHLGAILENGPDVPHDNFGTSQMSLMSQAQASHQGEQQMDSFQRNSVGCDSLGRMTNASSLTSKNSLIRHSSSPAGLLSELVSDVQGAYEGYPDEKIRNSLGLGSSCGDILPPNRVQNQMNCLRQNSSPPGLLSQLSMEMGVRQIGESLNMPMVGSSAENQAGSSSDDGGLGGGNLRQGYISNFQVGPWDDATMPSGELAGLQNGISFVARKRAKELDGSMMQGLHGTDAQVEGGNRGASALINRPYNLPRSTSAELAMDEFLQDSVPCKVRAKRGCATHPRSIAERVRRTRISERMRRLQELVPNSDKQTTNIADMLDEAVEYVKSLKKQVQEFTEERAKCTCIHRPDCAFKT